MGKVKVEVINKSKNDLPEYKTKGSAGVDLRADIEGSKILKPMERFLVPTGLYMSIPEGYEAQVRARSGLAINHGISLVNGIGTIDSDYRGEIKVILINFGDNDFIINNGDRIAQLVLAAYSEIDFIEVEKLDNTGRADGGMGHSGVK